MPKRRKKRRRIKKSIKKALLFIIVIVILLLAFKFFFSNDTAITKVNKKKTTIDLESIIVKENLKRYNYKEGFYYENLSKEIKQKITGKTYPKEFSPQYQSISYDDLRYIRVKYYDFEGNLHTDGELIVNKKLAKEVTEIFYKLYEGKYQFAKIKLVDEYDGDDNKSMEDNNTSAFNYRILEDSDDLSLHAFGLAIDINPLYNPYILGNEIYPSTGEEYTNRYKDFKGKIDRDDLAYKLFSEYDWKWGGDFINSKDYQHFYKEMNEYSIRKRKGV